LGATSLKVLYLFRAVGDIPSSGTAVAAVGRGGRQKHVTITHGVLIVIAHCVIAVVLFRELMEAAIYVFSQWTKVRIICH